MPMLTLMEGTWDEKTHTVTQYGDALDYRSGKLVKHKYTTKWTGNDHMDFEISVTGAESKEVTTLEIAYVRRK